MVKGLIYQFFRELIFRPSPHFVPAKIEIVQSPNCIYKQQCFSVSSSEKMGNWVCLFFWEGVGGLGIISMLQEISIMSLAAFVKPLDRKAKQMHSVAQVTLV